MKDDPQVSGNGASRQIMHQGSRQAALQVSVYARHGSESAVHPGKQ
jgi:hypothetical protein